MFAVFKTTFTKLDETFEFLKNNCEGVKIKI
jgi:hypothetical protein